MILGEKGLSEKIAESNKLREEIESIFSIEEICFKKNEKGVRFNLDDSEKEKEKDSLRFTHNREKKGQGNKKGKAGLKEKKANVIHPGKKKKKKYLKFEF